MVRRRFLLAASLAVWLGAAAEPPPADRIDWSTLTAFAKGIGAPDLLAPTMAVARAKAKKAAQDDAYRRLMDLLGGLRIAGTQTLGERMAADPGLRERIAVLARGAAAPDARYYSDGGVDWPVQVPLAGVLALVLEPMAGLIPPQAGSDQVTGVVVDARGLAAQPALAPRLVDDAGVAVYGANRIRKDAVKAGVATYAPTVELARKSPRVGDKPLVIKAAAAGGLTDLVVAKDDAERLAREAGGALAQGRVVVVLP